VKLTFGKQARFSICKGLLVLLQLILNLWL